MSCQFLLLQEDFNDEFINIYFREIQFWSLASPCPWKQLESSFFFTYARSKHIQANLVRILKKQSILANKEWQ